VAAKRLVLDANILVRAVLRVRVRGHQRDGARQSIPPTLG